MQDRCFAGHQNRSAVVRFLLVALVGLAMLLSAAPNLLAQSADDDHQTSSTTTHVRVYPVRPRRDVPKDDSHASPPPSIINESPIFPGPAGAHLTYYGGPVVSSVQVIVVFYGTGSYDSSLASGLPPFYTAITNGTFMDMLSEYGTVGQSGTTTNQLIHHGSYGGTFTITPSSANNGSTIDDSQIQAELNSQIAAGVLPAPTYDASGNANTLYMVYFPHGKTITQGGSSSCVSGGFCAYHGTFLRSSQDVLYGVQPDMQAGSGCDVGCGNASTSFQNYTSVASHEFAETATDAAVGLATVLGPPLAWYDNTNGEIGDICNAIQSTADGYTVQAEWSNLQSGCAVGPPTYTVTAPASATGGTAFSVTVKIVNSAGANITGYTGTIHFTSSDASATLPADYTYVSGDNGSHTFNVTLASAGTQTISVNDVVAIGFKGSASVSVSSNDFRISASPSSLSVQQGTSGSTTISTTAIGTASTVNFSVSGVPTGATASFSPTSVTAGGSSSLTVNAGTAAAGTYTLTVTGTSSTATHSTNVTLTVTTTPPAPDFTISASPTSVTVMQGSSGTSTISTTVVNSSGTVSLSVSGAPSGVTASLSPSSVTAGGSATLTLSASSSAAAGGYTITITGTEGSNTHSTSVSLTVTAPPPPVDFTISASPGTISVTQGSSGTSTISTAAINGGGTINLSVSGTPAGATASLSATTITAGSSATLTVNSGTAAAGSYTLTVTGVEGANTHSASVTLTISAVSTTIINGGFETGNLNGWTPVGSTSVVSPGHSGSYAAKIGASTPTNGDSSISQTFVVPSGGGTLSFWYKVVCPDTVTYDWATATLKDNTTGTTATLLGKTCTNTGNWAQATYNLAAAAGHNVTLKLVSHDDNYSGDPTYTLYDDVTIGAAPPPPPAGINNGGFETGSLSPWLATGSASITTTAHTGTYAALLGSTSPTLTSTLAQTFTVPAGATTLSFFYANRCPDTITYDWATVTLKDNTTGTTYTLLPRTCAATYAWTQVNFNVSAIVGHSVTLMLVNHDDNYPGDPTFTLYDDVTIH